MTRSRVVVLACLGALASASVFAQLAGGALLCDGVDDRATVPDSNGDFDMSTAMTLEVWVRHDSFADFGVAAFGFPGGYALGQSALEGQGRPNFSVSVPATGAAEGPSLMALGAWTHLAGTFDGSTIRLYINGTLAASKAHGGDVSDVDGLQFCRFGNSDNFLHGAIDEVRIWNVVRTGPQIAEAFNRTLTGSETGLVGYYRFDEGVGQTLIDSSLSGNDGFLGSTGAPAGDNPMRIVSGAPLVGGSACTRDARTACLLGGRFEVKVAMRDFSDPPVLFPGMVQTYGGQSSETDQSVSFYSFREGNVEIFVKMVDACSLAAFESFWLFAAGATNAETEILVRDTVAEKTVLIHNPPQVRFETVANTQAFVTCDF